MTRVLTDNEKNALSRAFARKSLAAFSIGMWDKFVVAKHHRTLISSLENVLRGTLKRLIITMPPRHGKSMLATRMFPGWFLGNEPTKSVIIASYGDDLATDFGRYVRNAMQSGFYGHVFPHVSVSEDSSSQKRFHTNAGGALFAVGRGGTITGRGADLIVVDDMFKNREDANSPNTRRMVLDWYRSTLRTRLEPGGAIVMVNTRWHRDDLIGHLLSEPTEDGHGWTHLNMPALDEAGAALWPDRFSVSELLAIKRDVGAFDFESLYQQNPTPAEGGIVKRDWIKFYRERPAKFNVMLQSWDMAFKETGTSDYVVGQAWGVIGSNLYLIDQVRARMDFVASKHAVKSFSAKHPQTLTKLVEDKANGSAIISELKNSIMGIKPINPNGSKAARLSAVAPLFEAGNVHLPDPSIAPWIHDYVEELVGFPTMKHDDQVDSTTQALLELKEYSAHSLMKLITL